MSRSSFQISKSPTYCSTCRNNKSVTLSYEDERPVCLSCLKRRIEQVEALHRKLLRMQMIMEVSNGNQT
jgi:hypothetical protein